MLNKRTAALLDHALAALRAAQLLELLGEADDGEHVPLPGEVSLRDIAAYSGLSVGTVHSFERAAIAKLHRGFIDQGLTPEEAIQLCRLLDNPAA